MEAAYSTCILKWNDLYNILCTLVCSLCYGTHSLYMALCLCVLNFIAVFGQRSGDLCLVGDFERATGRLEIYFPRAISFSEAVILVYVQYS